MSVTVVVFVRSFLIEIGVYLFVGYGAIKFVIEGAGVCYIFTSASV